MRVQVDPASFTAASERIGIDLATGLERVYQDLSIELGGCTAMTGTDSGGRSFGDDYDRAGSRAASAIADLDTAARRIGALLQATGFNHARAETDSNASHTGERVDRHEYDVSAPSRYGLPGGTGGIVPSSSGGSGHRPRGWELIDALVGFEWPDGRRDLLHHAAHAWRHASRGLAGLTGSVDEALTAIAAQDSPEVPDALAVCTRLRQHVLDVSSACASLAHACRQLAHRITEVHESVETALEWLLALAVGTEVVGAVFAFVTLGGSEGAAQAVEAAEAEVVAAEVTAYLTTFVAETEEIALVVSTAETEAVAVSTSLRPILVAEIRTAATRVVAALPRAVIADPALAHLVVSADSRVPSVRNSISTSARIKQAGLPTGGSIRYVPRKNYHPGDPLPNNAKGSYIDRFNNLWKKGPSRTPGEPYEWDVTLSPLGKAKIGWLSRDGKHVNVSLKGWVTH